MSENSCPSVYVIILNWNGYTETSRCVESIKENVEYDNINIVIVDNGSDDNSGRYLANKFDDSEVLYNEYNLGFAGGNQTGIKYALSNDADYILLLNNDTIAENDFVSPLVETAESYDDAGIVGGLIKHHNTNKEGYWYAGGEISTTTVKISTETELKNRNTFETGYCSGAMMLISQEVFKEGDILREEYFFGTDQLDTSWRCRQLGYKIYLNPEAQVRHESGATVQQQSPFKIYYGMRGRLFFARENLGVKNKIVFYTWFFMTRPIVISKWLVQKRYSDIVALLMAIFDHIQGNYPVRDFPVKDGSIPTSDVPEDVFEKDIQ